MKRLKLRSFILIVTVLSFLICYTLLQKAKASEQTTYKLRAEWFELDKPPDIPISVRDITQETIDWLSNGREPSDDLSFTVHETSDPPLTVSSTDPPLSPEQQECSNTIPDDIINVGVVVTSGYRQNYTSLPFLVLLKSTFINRHRLPLHFHFLSDSVTNKTIHKLLSTWNIPYFNWTVYCTPQTESIPSLVYGNILLHMLLPPTVNELIVLSMDSLVIKDLSQLWHYLEHHKSSRPPSLDDYQSNVLLTKRSISSLSSNINGLRSVNNLLDVMNKMSFIVPCGMKDGFWCQQYVITQQMQVRETAAYHKTHSSLEYDGDVEQNVFLKCDGQISYSKKNKMVARDKTYCGDLAKIAEYKYRSLIYFFGQHYFPNDNHDVTLVSQLTFDRVSRIPILLAHWTGPVSIAVYTADEEIEELYNVLKSSDIISERARKNLAIHVVFNHSRIYPINYMRNVALDSVTTPYVFLNDLDFLPNYDCYSQIKNAIDENDLSNNKKTALVLPAFETVEHEVPFPKSKKEIRSLIREKKVRQFHIKVWKRAHSATLYRRWRIATKPYKIKYRFHYEPYVVVSSDVVRYDTRFVGFGWNKVSHIMELHAASYTFIVLPDVFVLHMWHPVSLQNSLFQTKKFRHCLSKQQNASHEYIVSKYGKFKIVY